jgi:hypothetical protein
MSTREVIMNLKDNSQAEFTQTMEKEVIPVLWTEGCVQDEIIFPVPGEAQAVANSGSEVYNPPQEDQLERADYLH